MIIDRLTMRLLHVGWLSICCVLLAAQVSLGDTLRVVTNNSLQFHGQQNSDRVPYFRTVMRAIHPDVVMMEEVASEQAMDYMLAQVYAQLDTDWATANFMPNGDLNNTCFYRQSKVALVSQRAIATDLRDINEYVLRPVSGDTTARLHIFAAHLKANNDSASASRRGREAAIARQQTDALPAGTNFLICGDFNLYSSSETAWQNLTVPGSNPNGQFNDPVNRVGAWHDNPAYADVHTQSTRVADLGDGGATGGLDDRFDFILVSNAMMDSTGSHVIPGTYHAYGNDGQHLNRAINDGTNLVVPDSIAYALCHATDHLPVVVDMVLGGDGGDRAVTIPSPNDFAVWSCYPNPFNSVLTIKLPALPRGSISIFDILGRRIFDQDLRHDATATTLQVDFSRFGSGTYFVELRTPAASAVQRVSYVR